MRVIGDSKRLVVPSGKPLRKHLLLLMVWITHEDLRIWGRTWSATTTMTSKILSWTEHVGLGSWRCSSAGQSSQDDIKAASIK